MADMQRLYIILSYIFAISFILTLIIVPLTIKISTAFNILKPVKDKKMGKPCIGGLAIYSGLLLAIFTALYFGNIHSYKLFGMLISSLPILILGFIDDIKDIKPVVKIIWELIAVFILMFFGIATRIVYIPLWLNLLITSFWFLFITNAFNLLDIMDGLMSGLVVIISSALLVISLTQRDISSSAMLAALIGGHLGFLKYNYPPAKVYMGDTGSLFSGFLLAAIAINISYAPLEKPLALLTPILIMSMPIYDTVFLIIMRIKRRKIIFKKTQDHFALRLLAMGFTVQKSLWFMYIFSIFLAVASLIIVFGPDMLGYISILVVILVFIVTGKYAGMVKIEEK